MRHRMFIKLVLLSCILAATLATEELKDPESSNKQDDQLRRIIDNDSVETSVLHNISSNFEKLLSSELEKETDEFVLPDESATETSATSTTVQDDIPKPSLRQGMKRNRNRLFLDDPSAAEKSSGRKKGDYRWGASETDDFLQKLDRDPTQQPQTYNVVVAKNSNAALVSAMSKISAHHVSHSSNSNSGLKQLLSSSLKEANDKATSNKVMTENVNEEQGNFVNANSDLSKLRSAINGLLNNPNIYENKNNKLSIVPNDNEDLVEAILNATIGNDQSDKLNGHQTILNVIVINVSNNILKSNSSSGADNRIGAMPDNYLTRYMQNQPSYPQQAYNPYNQKQASRPQQILKGQNLNVVGQKNSVRIDNRQGINLNKNTVLDLLPDFIRATTIPPIVSLFNTSAHRNLGAKPSVLGLLPNEVFDVQKTTVDLHSNHIGGGVVRKNDPIETWKPYPDAKLPYSVPNNVFGYSLKKDKIDTSKKKVEPVPQLMNKYNGAIKRKPTIKVNNQQPMASMPLPQQTQASPQDFSIFDLLGMDDSNNDQHIVYPIDNATMFENFRNYTRTAFENISNTSLRNIMIGAIPSTAAMATATFPVWAPVLLGKRRRKRDTITKDSSALWYNLINGSLYLKNKFPASDASTSNASDNNKVFTSDLAALLKKSTENYDDPYEYYDSNELEFSNIIYDKKLDRSDSIINYDDYKYSLKNDNLDIEKSSNLENKISSFVIYKDNSEDTKLSEVSKNSTLTTAANNVSTDEELPFGDVDLVNNLIFQMDDKSHAAKVDNVNEDDISHNNDQNVSEEDITPLTTEIPKFANISKNDSADMYVINGKLSSLVNSVILNEINQTNSSDGIDNSKPEDVTEIITESGGSIMQNPVDSRIDNSDRNISNNEEKIEMFQYLKSELQNENYLMNVNNTESVDNLTLSMTIPMNTNTSTLDDSFFTTIALSNIISESDQKHSSIESVTVSDLIDNIKSLITRYPTTQMKNRSEPTKSTNPMKILSTIKSTTPTNVVRQTTPPFTTTAAPITTTTPTPGTHAVRQNTPVTTRFVYYPPPTTTTTTTMKPTPAQPQDLYSYITNALANPSRQLAEAVSYSSTVAVYTAAALMPIWLPMSIGKRKKRSVDDSNVQPKYYPGELLRNNLKFIDNEQ